MRIQEKEIWIQYQSVYEKVTSIFIEVITSRTLECGLYLTGEIYRLASLLFLSVPNDSILTVSDEIIPPDAYAFLLIKNSGFFGWNSFVSPACAGKSNTFNLFAGRI